MRDPRLPNYEPVQQVEAYPAANLPLQEEEARQELVFDEQFGIRLGGRSYYVNLRIGREMRSRSRLISEGQVPVSGAAFLYCVICSGAIMLFGTLCMLYLLKSGMGLDFTDESSVLHPLFEMIMGD